MSTVQVKKRKRRKPEEEEKTKGAEDVSTQNQGVQAQMVMLVNQVSNLTKIVMDLKKNTSVSKDLSKTLDNVEEKLDETLEELSPKKKKKVVEKNPPEKSVSVLSEDYFEEQVKNLAKVYREQRKLYGQTVDFEEKGWPKIQKVVKKLNKKIDPTFMPRSKKSQFTFSKNSIDHNGEKYLDHCKNLVNKNVHVIKTRKDGNCFPFAISLGLNGDGDAQKNELRIRGALYYATYYKNIHTHGQHIGWANTTGKPYFEIKI